MDDRVRITFHSLETSPAIEAYARKRATKLERLYRRISECHVNLERPHAHKHHPAPYRVRIELTVPGAKLVVSRTPELDSSRENLYAAIDAAFDAASRILQDYAQKQRREVKTHARPGVQRGGVERVG